MRKLFVVLLFFISSYCYSQSSDCFEIKLLSSQIINKDSVIKELKLMYLSPFASTIGSFYKDSSMSIQRPGEEGKVTYIKTQHVLIDRIPEIKVSGGRLIELQKGDSIEYSMKFCNQKNITLWKNKWRDIDEKITGRFEAGIHLKETNRNNKALLEFNKCESLHEERLRYEAYLNYFDEAVYDSIGISEILKEKETIDLQPKTINDLIHTLLKTFDGAITFQDVIFIEEGDTIKIREGIRYGLECKSINPFDWNTTPFSDFYESIKRLNDNYYWETLDGVKFEEYLEKLKYRFFLQFVILDSEVQLKSHIEKVDKDGRCVVAHYQRQFTDSDLLDTIKYIHRNGNNKHQEFKLPNYNTFKKVNELNCDLPNISECFKHTLLQNNVSSIDSILIFKPITDKTSIFYPNIIKSDSLILSKLWNKFNHKKSTYSLALCYDISEQSEPYRYLQLQQNDKPIGPASPKVYFTFKDISQNDTTMLSLLGKEYLKLNEKVINYYAVETDRYTQWKYLDSCSYYIQKRERIKKNILSHSNIRYDKITCYTNLDVKKKKEKLREIQKQQDIYFNILIDIEPKVDSFKTHFLPVITTYNEKLFFPDLSTKFLTEIKRETNYTNIKKTERIDYTEPTIQVLKDNRYFTRFKYSYDIHNCFFSYQLLDSWKKDTAPTWVEIPNFDNIILQGYDDDKPLYNNTHPDDYSKEINNFRKIHSTIYNPSNLNQLFLSLYAQNNELQQIKSIKYIERQNTTFSTLLYEAMITDSLNLAITINNNNLKLDTCSKFGLIIEYNEDSYGMFKQLFLVKDNLIVGNYSSKQYLTFEESYGGVKFVLKKGGRIRVSKDINESVKYNVIIPAFSLSSKITINQYCMFLDKMNVKENGYLNDTLIIFMRNKNCRIKYDNGVFRPKKDGNGEKNINYISWYGAKKYCEWLGSNYRLPNPIELMSINGEQKIYEWCEDDYYNFYQVDRTKPHKEANGREFDPLNKPDNISFEIYLMRLNFIKHGDTEKKKEFEYFIYKKEKDNLPYVNEYSQYRVVSKSGKSIENIFIFHPYNARRDIEFRVIKEPLD